MTSQKVLLTSAGVVLINGVAIGTAVAADSEKGYEGAGEAKGDYGYGAFYENPAFWVSAAMVVLLAFIGRKAWSFVTSGLDGYSKSVAAKLDDARKVREEAAAFLAECEEKQQASEQRATEILAQAKSTVQDMKQQAERELQDLLKRREEAAMGRIAQAETQAVQDVRDEAVDVAVEAAQRLVAERAKGQDGDDMVNQAITEVQAKLQ